MEIKLWELRNISRRLCEEVAASKGAEAHTLGTTGLDSCLTSQMVVRLSALRTGRARSTPQKHYISVSGTNFC
jgi:hypothetical protein